MRPWDHWQLLRSGNVREGLNQLKSLQPGYSDASWVKELGVAYLWMGEFRNASEHFSQAIASHPRTNDAFYGMLGVAEWCLNDYAKAVEHWHEGLAADYVGAAGLGIGLPLLIYAASILRPATCEITTARELLREREGDARIAIWPGPIANWLLASISDTQVKSLCETSDPEETQHQLWQLEFYKGVVQYGAGERKRAREVLAKVSDTSAAEWSPMETFVDRLWCEEFFLARHEAGHFSLRT